MSEGDQNPKSPLPRFIRGKRPQFFDDPAADHLLAMVLELSAEVWVGRSRQMALEAYLKSKDMFDTEAFERFEMTEEDHADLAAWRSEFMKRLMRTIDAEAATQQAE